MHVVRDDQKQMCIPNVTRVLMNDRLEERCGLRRNGELIASAFFATDCDEVHLLADVNELRNVVRQPFALGQIHGSDRREYENWSQ